MLRSSHQCQSFQELMWVKDQFMLGYKAQFEDMSTNSALLYWQAQVLANLNEQYKEEVAELVARNIIPEKRGEDAFTIGDLRYIQFDIPVHIASIDCISKEQKERMTKCYESFVRWLDKECFGWFKLRRASEANLKPTLFEVWRLFIETLGEINKRDELIARTLIQGQKRVTVVLNLQIDQIDFEKGLIIFDSKKRKEQVEYDDSFMKELKEYIEKTANTRGDSSIVFITRNGRAVTRMRLNYSFARVCSLIPVIKQKITPDSLRFMWNQLIREGYTDAAIMNSKEARMEQSEKCRIEFLKKINPEIPK